MDSINTLKGYGKVGEQVDPATRRKIRSRMIIIIVCSIVLATLIMCVLAKTFIYSSNSEVVLQSNGKDPMAMMSSAESIKTVCNVTKYPELCFSSISSLENKNKADTEEVFRLSLQVSIKELSKLSSVPQNLIPKVNNDPMVETALRDCQSLFEDSIDRVNESISLLGQQGVEKIMLTASKIKNIQTWLSSAITNQETCLDGLDESCTGKSSCSILNLKEEMQNSTKFTSNSLAIVAKILKLKIPIHRKLFYFSD